MKITIVQGAFLPVPTLRGGAVEKMWFELGKQFASGGHSVTHISRRFTGLPITETIEGVKHVRVRGYDWPSNPIILKCLDLFYSLRVLGSLPRSDILITNTFWMPLLTFLFQPRFGKVIVDVQRIPKGQIRLYSFVACIRANSSSVLNAILREAPGLAMKVVTIPNPLPYEAPPLTVVERDNIILYCGRLHPEKGIELLLSAFQLACQRGLQNWTLRLVGSADISDGGGGPDWMKRLVQIQTRHGLSVEWVGPIYKEHELQTQYQNAPIFVYPSLADEGESFGMAPLEAMAFGAVPIVSSVACFQDFITTNVNGIIFDHRKKNSAFLLSTAILELVHDTKLRAKLSSQAFNVRRTHHPSIIAKSFLALFSKVS